MREEEYEINARESKRNTDIKKRQGKAVAQHQPVSKESDDQIALLKNLMEQMKIMNTDIQELKQKPPQQYETQYRGRGRGRGDRFYDQTPFRGRGRGRGGQQNTEEI